VRFWVQSRDERKDRPSEIQFIKVNYLQRDVDSDYLALGSILHQI
jgi:hypothetical protein